MGILSLGIPEGGKITVVANGKDEQEAISALEQLAETGELAPEMR